MRKIKIKPIPGNPQEAKNKLYDAIKQQVMDNALSPASLEENLNFLSTWWNYLGDVTIGENTIEMQFYAGITIEKASHCLYQMANQTGMIITASFNDVKIIMVAQHG